MHCTMVDTQELAKVISLPDDLKKNKTLELLINPACPNKKAKLKKQLAFIFKKAKQTKIPGNVDIDALMNEMNDNENILHLSSSFSFRFWSK